MLGSGMGSELIKGGIPFPFRSSRAGVGGCFVRSMVCVVVVGAGPRRGLGKVPES